MSLEIQVADLTTATTELTAAVLFKKQELELAVASAQASAVAAAASAAGTTPGAGTGTVDNALLTNEVNRATAAEYLKADKLTTYTKVEVMAIIQGLIGTAPATLDTFQELAAKMLVDESGVAALVIEIGTKAPLLHTHAPATPTADGFMTAAEKIKLAGISEGASAGGIVATTLAGYGINDAYTKAQIDNLISVLSGGGGVADWATITGKPNFGTAAQSNIGDFATPLSVTNEVNRATAAEYLKADKLTTYTKLEVTAIIQGLIGNAPATLDTFQELAAKMLVDESGVAALVIEIGTKAPLLHTHAPATPTADGFMTAAEKIKLAGISEGASAGGIVATTLAGYGINDAYTKAQIDNLISVLSGGGGTADWATITGKPNFGTAAQSNVGDFATPLSVTNEATRASQVEATKVDKITGYSLTKNDFTDILKAKLDSITAIFTTGLKTSYDNAVAWISTNGTNLISHLSNTSNPHNVTKTQIGLPNVDNTSDANKPVSALQATADALVLSTAKAYTDTTVSTEVSERNTAITAAINALLNGAPDALNTLMEISAKFESDGSIVQSLITTVGGKIATSDIIDDLLTNVANKPLSAAQGVFLKSLIDGLSNSLENKVDKAPGYSLTKNDFTDILKAKLDSITAIFTTALKTSYDSAVVWVSSHANVDNTSDLLKPPSTAQIALNTSYDAKMNNPMEQQGDIIYAGPGGVPMRLPKPTVDSQVFFNTPAGIPYYGPPIAGKNATVVIGTITTIAAGGTATVTNVGDTLNAVLNFQIPRGNDGVPGLAGSNSLLIAPLEQWNVVSAAATGVVNIDIITASVWLYVLPAITSFSLNVRGNSGATFASKLAIGQSCTVVFGNTSGSTPYFPVSFSIDGVQVYPQWSGGLSPNSGNSNSTDMYAYVIVRTGVSTYKVYANQTKFA